MSEKSSKQNDEDRLYRFPLIIDSMPIVYCLLLIVQVIVIAALADKRYDFGKGDKSYREQFDLYMVFFPIHLTFAIMLVRIFMLYQRNGLEIASLAVNAADPPSPESMNYIPLTIRGLLDETVVNARPTIYCIPLYIELWCITSNLNLPPDHRYSWFFAFIPLFGLLMWMLFESAQKENWYGSDVRKFITSFALRQKAVHQRRVENGRKASNNNNNNNNADIIEQGDANNINDDGDELVLGGVVGGEGDQ